MAQRLTVEETAGSQRAYSYLISEELTLGTFTDSDLPQDLGDELEALSQSDSAPDFLWDPSGNLVYTVVEV